MFACNLIQSQCKHFAIFMIPIKGVDFAALFSYDPSTYNASLVGAQDCLKSR